jgi:hypothetical protein
MKRSPRIGTRTRAILQWVSREFFNSIIAMAPAFGLPTYVLYDPDDRAAGRDAASGNKGIAVRAEPVPVSPVLSDSERRGWEEIIARLR